MGCIPCGILETVRSGVYSSSHKCAQLWSQAPAVCRLPSPAKSPGWRTTGRYSMWVDTGVGSWALQKCFRTTQGERWGHTAMTFPLESKCRLIWTLGKQSTPFLISETGLEKCLPNKTAGVRDEAQLRVQSTSPGTFPILVRCIMQHWDLSPHSPPLWPWPSPAYPCFPRPQANQVGSLTALENPRSPRRLPTLPTPHARDLDRGLNPSSSVSSPPSELLANLKLWKRVT